jgi:tRNA-5-methyluridine54 2-sulfurtransferase
MTTMICHRCKERASIRMRQHRLSFCKDHYIEWFVEQTERAIHKYHMLSRDERVLVAVSGGKDSLALWDVLWQLNYPADGLYINLGIDSEEDYSDESEQYSHEFAEARGLKLHVVNIEAEYGESVPKIARRNKRGKHKPCSACGLVKRHEMNRIARTMGYSVLATAHNLDDEVAILLGNVMMWQTDLLSRQSPVLDESEGFSRKVKPFCRFYERETAAYTLLRGIPYIEEECPFAEGSKQLYYKELINQMEEEQPGIKLAFYVGFLNSKEKGAFPVLPAVEKDLLLKPCPICGQPTTNSGACAFCRTVAPKPEV